MSGLPNYLRCDGTSEKYPTFLMLPPDILDEPAFQELSYAGRMFYITLCLHKQTTDQEYILKKALQYYNNVLNLGLSEEDIDMEVHPYSYKRNYSKDYFVAPQKQLLKYGWKRSYINRLKQELIDHGFIKVAYGGKHRFNAWNENTTIYQFVKWR